MFVVIMREPMLRFKSGFFWEFNPKFYGKPSNVRHHHNRRLSRMARVLRRVAFAFIARAQARPLCAL